MDDILGNQEALNATHVLESNSYVESCPDRDLLEKEYLDEEILSASHAQKENDVPGLSVERT